MITVEPPKDDLDRLSQIENLFVAAHHALRSYQFGNTSTDLAANLADLMEPLLPYEVGK